MDAFVAIFDPSIKNSRSGQLVYSTYFGGTGPDTPFDLKLDAKGILYLVGYTLSPGLPTSANALQTGYDGSLDAFALTIDPSQPGPAGLGYLTYLGSDGFQIAYGIDYDTSGHVYLTGFTSGSLFTPFRGATKTTGAGNTDAFVVGFSIAP